MDLFILRFPSVFLQTSAVSFGKRPSPSKVKPTRTLAKFPRILNQMILLSFLLSLCIYATVLGFQQHVSNPSVTRALPLKTAGNDLLGFIPRLEPGLRILKAPQYIFGDMRSTQRVNTFCLDLLHKCLIHPEFHTDLLAMDKSHQEDLQARGIPLNVLFANAKEQLGKCSLKMKRYLRSLLAITSLLTSSINIPTLASTSQAAIVNLRKAAMIATGSVVTAIAAGPKLIAHASLLKRYSALTPIQRLATTPVYYVGNSQSNAYLQEDYTQTGNPDSRVITCYLSYEDAFRYLEEITQATPAQEGSEQPRIITTSMEKIMDTIQRKKQSRKLGKVTMPLIYRLQASSRQVEHAQKLSSNKDPTAVQRTIPMFSAPGLVMQRVNGDIVSPYYFALEDLQADWQKMVTTAAAEAGETRLPAQPKQVLVHDFADVMCLTAGINRASIQGKDTESVLEAIADYQQVEETAASSAGKMKGELSKKQLKKALETPGIVPPREEIEMLKRYYRHQEGIPGEYSRPKLFRQQ